MMTSSITSAVSGALLLMALSTAVVRADESDIVLKPGDGLDVVEGNCSACHSLDFIQMNSPVQDEKGWTETVTKMVHVMGAPITDEDQKQIIKYLSANYSK
jgi:cytochrome c5